MQQIIIQQFKGHLTTFIPILFLFLILAGRIQSSCKDHDPASEKPNILFIAADDLRPMMGCYGIDHIKTPNLDRLAERGTVFLNNYCQFPLCGPTRASLLTGIRPDDLKIYGNQTHIRETVPEVITLPQHFKNHGYHTVGYGKIYHNRDMDDSLSWSEPGLPVEGYHFGDYNNPHTRKMLRDITDEDPVGTTLAPPTDSADVPDNAYSDGRFADLAIEAMKHLKKEKQPFFIAVGFVRPHLPFNSPTKYWNMYDREQIPLADYRELPANFPEVPVYDSWWMRHFHGMPQKGPFSDSISRHLNHAYSACVSFVDAQIGRLLDALEEFELENNTIIIFWGDHGYQLGDHGIYGKHTNFELALRSPLILSVPGTEGVQRIAKLTEFVDIYPSLCELTGLPVPDHLQGTSFVTLMENSDMDWKKAAFSQYLQQGHMGYSLRTNRYRYTRWVHQSTGETSGIELYDYREDPNEKINLAGSGSHQRIVRELEEMLNEGWQGAAPRKSQY
jgi:arylsulfatase A-like enzyme